LFRNRARWQGAASEQPCHPLPQRQALAEFVVLG
jgi:hypothetical protein